MPLRGKHCKGLTAKNTYSKSAIKQRTEKAL